MGVFSWFRSRDTRDSTLKDPEQWLLEALLGSTTTPAGVAVSPELALAVPDVFSCLQVLSQDVARTPLTLQAVDRAGNRLDATSHRLWELLHDLANPETTAFEFRYGLTWDLLTHERAYAEIQRRPDGAIEALWRLDDPRRMTVDRTPSGEKRWRYRQATGAEQVWVFDPSRPPILELRMLSPVRRCREVIGLVVALEQYAGKFFANSARLSGLFSLPPQTTEGKREEFKQKVKQLFTGGPGQAHQFMVASGDAKYTPFTATNDEAQFVETRKYMRSVVAGAFRVPPHKIGDLDRATFTNIEHQEIEYVNGALGPLYTLWEQALRRDILTTRQYPQYDVTFDRTVLIQGDLASLMNALHLGIQSGMLTINDGRRRLHLNTAPPGIGDVHMVNGNMQPVTTQTTGAEPASAAPPAPTQVM